MKTLEEIRKTPVLLLNDEEIGQLNLEDQEWVRNARARRAREQACSGHEAIPIGTPAQALRGWHPAKCKHCGIDMSVDSGD